MAKSFGIALAALFVFISSGCMLGPEHPVERYRNDPEYRARVDQEYLEETYCNDWPVTDSEYNRENVLWQIITIQVRNVPPGMTLSSVPLVAQVTWRMRGCDRGDSRQTLRVDEAVGVDASGAATVERSRTMGQWISDVELDELHVLVPSAADPAQTTQVNGVVTGHSYSASRFRASVEFDLTNPDVNPYHEFALYKARAVRDYFLRHPMPLMDLIDQAFSSLLPGDTDPRRANRRRAGDSDPVPGVPASGGYPSRAEVGT